ncbi:MAG: uracil-DNA glycosylase [Burkholderiales bacterium]|nr:uracil-DNA glycosylase [Burkholderiales bacterium]
MSSQKTEFPDLFEDAIKRVHPTWHAAVRAGLCAVHSTDPSYLPTLAQTDFLPSKGRLFAAFDQPVHQVRYVLIGEGPYPREESATGYCFMDGAVQRLWSDELGGGLSKKVNRATSLRNFMKMLLVADGQLAAENSGIEAMARIAEVANKCDSALIQTLDDLQTNLGSAGFLLLNASLVFRHDVAPAKDAKAWQPFLQVILSALKHECLSAPPVQLILWGKIAEQIKKVPVSTEFPQITAEHPYNLSFIKNQVMHSLFKPMRLLENCQKEKLCKK